MMRVERTPLQRLDNWRVAVGVSLAALTFAVAGCAHDTDAASSVATTSTSEATASTIAPQATDNNLGDLLASAESIQGPFVISGDCPAEGTVLPSNWRVNAFPGNDNTPDPKTGELPPTIEIEDVAQYFDNKGYPLLWCGSDVGDDPVIGVEGFAEGATVVVPAMRECYADTDALRPGLQLLRECSAMPILYSLNNGGSNGSYPAPEERSPSPYDGPVTPA